MSKITNQSRVTSKYTLPDQTQVEAEAQSNTSQTEYMTDSFKKNRTTAKNFGVPKEEILQYLTLQNNSDNIITDIKIQDTISLGVTFKENSLKIDEVEYANFNPVTGFTLPDVLQSGASTTISYIITIDEQPTVEKSELVSSVTYSVNEISELQEMSNSVEIEIITERLSITKSSNLTAVISGQVITFKNVIKNEGRTTLTDIIFYDPIPSGAKFVANSVKIDNQTMPGYDPAVGFKLDDLDAQEEITVTFEVIVEWWKNN